MINNNELTVKRMKYLVYMANKIITIFLHNIIFTIDEINTMSI